MGKPYLCFWAIYFCKTERSQSLEGWLGRGQVGSGRARLGRTRLFFWKFTSFYFVQHFKTWNIRTYITIITHVTTFHILQGEMKKYFLVCGRVTWKENLTRAMRPKQSHIFCHYMLVIYFFQLLVLYCIFLLFFQWWYKMHIFFGIFFITIYTDLRFEQ